jgi:protein gp37
MKMGAKTSIQWCDATWNIARGCTKVDEDCKYCYMYRDSLGGTRYNPLKVVRTKTVFDLPMRIKESSRIFTSSLTDFLHKDCDKFRYEAWEIIRKTPHTYLILSKRIERLREHLPPFWDEIRSRCWIGTSIGSEAGIHRINDLIACRDLADILFVSFEPLYEELPNFDITTLMQIDWIIIGGESGNDTGKYRYRPCKIEWIESLVDDFRATSKIFVKQLGTHLAKEMKMTDRHGGNIKEFPKHLQLHEFPKGR